MFLVNFTLLKYVKSQRSYGFLITKEMIFGFQILGLKDHFSASLKSSLLPVFFNLNVGKFKNLRLLLNRCQSLCQMGFVCVLIKLSYKTCSSMLHLKLSISLILQSYSQIFIVKHIDLNLVELIWTTKNCSVSGLVKKPSVQ